MSSLSLINSLPIQHKEFEDKTFSNENYTSLNFKHAHFKNCTFINCNFSLTQVEHCRFIDCLFDSCKLTGIDFNLCHKHLFRIEFKNSLIHSCNFSQMSFIKTCFTSCKIQESIFEGTNLKEALFDNCDLSQSTFINCNLFSTDFRKAQNYSFNPSENFIKKAKFSMPDAIGLLNYFDIEIF